MNDALAFGGLFAMLAVSYGIAWLVGARQTAATQSGRTGCLDGLRGYLALSVVAHHFLRVWNAARSGSMVEPDGNIVFQNLGPTAVMLFFMITAFLFYGKIVSAHGRPDWRALYASRLFRLTPAYWVAIALMLILLMQLQGWALQVPAGQFLSELAHWLIFTLAGNPPINGLARTGSLLAGVIWTLRYEWLFYLSLPLVGLAVAAVGQRPVVRFAGLVAAFAAVVFGPSITLFHFSSYFALPFLLGMMAAELNGVARIRAMANGWAGTLAGIACLAALLTIPPEIDVPLRAPLFLVFFLTVVAGNSYFGLLLRRPSVLLGDASYSIYLFHGLALNTVPVLFGATIYSGSDGLAGWLLLPPIGGAIVLVAITNYRVVEAPFIRLGRAVLRPRHEPPVLAKIAP